MTIYIFVVVRVGRRLPVSRGTENPLAPSLLQPVRGPRTGGRDYGRRGDGRRPPDTGQRPGGAPGRQHGGDRSVGEGVQRTPGVVPVHRLGGVFRRRRVHRRPVLDVRDTGRRPGGRHKETGRGRRAPAVRRPARATADRPHTRHGVRAHRPARSPGHRHALWRQKLKKTTYIIYIIIIINYIIIIVVIIVVIVVIESSCTVYNL